MCLFDFLSCARFTKRLKDLVPFDSSTEIDKPRNQSQRTHTLELYYIDLIVNGVFNEN